MAEEGLQNLPLISRVDECLSRSPGRTPSIVGVLDSLVRVTQVRERGGQRDVVRRVVGTKASGSIPCVGRVLSRFIEELGIDTYQHGLEEKLDRILAERIGSPSKEEVKREIRSNHMVANKVIDALMKEGLVAVSSQEARYRGSIRRAVMHHIRSTTSSIVESNRSKFGIPIDFARHRTGRENDRAG